MMVNEIPARPQPPLTLAISDCLLGSEVRYDGGHKKSAFPHDALAGLYVFRGICPEVGIGLGIPRTPIRLTGDVNAPRAAVYKGNPEDPGHDVTDRLAAYADAQVEGLTDVAGYVLMKNSPSCGLFRVKVYAPGDEGGMPDPSGRGVYAAGITRRMPDLPVEESGRLQDPVLRENFVTRTFAYAHWLRLAAQNPGAAQLIEFHSRYKYLLMAHSMEHYRLAGRLLSNLKGDLAPVRQQYIACLMTGLARPATPGSHANVLSHLQGYLKRTLASADRVELAEAIDAYRRGEVPLLAPLALLKHHFRRTPHEYVLHQTYLDPHPPAQGLRRPL